MIPPIIQPPLRPRPTWSWKWKTFTIVTLLVGFCAGLFLAQMSQSPSEPSAYHITNSSLSPYPNRVAYFEKEIRDGTDAFYGPGHVWTAEEEQILRATARAAAKDYPAYQSSISFLSTDPNRIAYFEKEIRDVTDAFYGPGHVWTAEEEQTLRATAMVAAEHYP